MTPIPSHLRVLGIAPSSKGVGFAVLEGDGLIDWGVKTVRGDKNPRSLSKIKDLMTFYSPQAVIIESTSAPVRRASRIQELSTSIAATAKLYQIRVVTLLRREVRQAFLGNSEGSKHSVAKILAERFPDELGPRLPPKRQPWMSEDQRMGVFEAVALVLAFRLKQRSRLNG